ncbi:hypothetical protein C8R45DRAFT_1003777, partial [Mycena sanguinolenta]
MELQAHEQAAENAIPSAHVGQRSRRDTEHAERRPNANSQVAADSVIRISYAHNATRNAAPRRTHAPQKLRNDRTLQHSSSRIRNGRAVSLARAVAPRICPLPVLTQIDSGRHFPAPPRHALPPREDRHHAHRAGRNRACFFFSSQSPRCAFRSRAAELRVIGSALERIALCGARAPSEP